MRLKRAQKSNHLWVIRERSKEAKTRRHTMTFHLDKEPRCSSRRHNGPQGRSMGNADFSTISVILGECTASRLVLKEGRPAVRNGPWRVVGWVGPCGERDAPARREFGFSGLPGATFPFLLVYLLSTKHRSFFAFARPSQP